MMQQADEPRLVFHYAVADNGVIGKDNAMPWHVSSDLNALQGDDHGQAADHGAADLPVHRASLAGAHQYCRHAG